MKELQVIKVLWIHLLKGLQSPAIMAESLKKISSSKPKTQNLKETETISLSSNFHELYDRILLLLQEKLAGFFSNISIGDVVAIAAKLLNY